MSFIIQYLIAGEKSDLIATVRPLHQAYIERFQDCIQLTAVTREEEGGPLTGAIFVLNVEDQVAAVQFSADDPYVRAGIFTKLQIAWFEKRRGWVG